jgi:protein-tyrosine phosphatase
MGYVDIHSHVLYGLDDGAKTREQSVQMFEIAVQSGTTDIVATPHANGQYEFDPELIEERIAELSAETELRIYPGCDFHLQFDNIEDAVAHPTKYTINHQNYLLVEFSDLSVFHTAGEILERLMDAGMIPIVTHPERNARLQRSVDDIARWVADGSYVQVTAGSVVGTFGKAARASVDELLQRGLVHFIASDAHDCVRRPPSLREAYDRLAGDWGEETIRPLFVDNPNAAVAGETIDYELPERTSGRRKWYRFW